MPKFTRFDAISAPDPLDSSRRLQEIIDVGDNMHPATINVTNVLESIKNIIFNAIPSEQTLNTIWGWNQPSLTRRDIVGLITETQSGLINGLSDVLSEEEQAVLNSIPGRISVWQTQALPNIAGGNAMWVIATLRDELDRLDRLVSKRAAARPAPDWEKLANDGFFPPKIASRLRAMQTRLDRLAPNFDVLEEQIKSIGEAYEAADRLPETIESLEEGRRELLTVRTEAQSQAASAATHAREASEAQGQIESLAKEATSKFSDLENAYRAAATKGLASAFQKRADGLGWSVRLWVVVLVCDLAAGAVIGYLRFEELQKVLSLPQPSAVVWGNIAFSALSLAAPVWLGWVATKQVSQRFKLAEDYGFKATVASAYEAWKAESQKMDEQFGKRLFGSALSRLEEAPLRLVEAENYGSPWHEFVKSPAFAKAVDILPDLKAAYAKFMATSSGAASAAGAVITALGAHAGSRTDGDGAQATKTTPDPSS